MLKDPTYNPRREQLEEKFNEMVSQGSIKDDKAARLKENIQ